MKKETSKPRMYNRVGIILTLLCFFSVNLFAQVELRDTTITWQHHSFELNDDYSMKSYSTNDNDIEQVSFTGAKIIENELIKLVLVPEYGGRVLSFQYKPTGHEYLYQSECGSPYGMGDGNFYYNWLMVWGGIFPTFPEPEHGKTWLKPWKFSIVKETTDTVLIQMEYKDSTSYTSAPGSFSKGITGITCRIEVGVYSGASVWDFKVSLINNKAQAVNYEYWTCTTLTPGCELGAGNTASPLNSEIVVPFDQYEAAWSPGSWIGSYGSLNDISNIDYLSKWDNMGIAYAHNLNDNYWGVINHDNDEGIIRISDNVETPGMKFWTWGKNEVDNNMYDFSNGGKDNYIELWAGASDAFFTNATLSSNEIKTWTESYCAITDLKSISSINKYAATNIEWNESDMNLSYSLNTFRPDEEYAINLYLDGASVVSVADKTIQGERLGNFETFSLTDFHVLEGSYTVNLELSDDEGNLLVDAQKNIYIPSVAPNSLYNVKLSQHAMKIWNSGDQSIHIELSDLDSYKVVVVGLNGQVITEEYFKGYTTELYIPYKGLCIIQVSGSNSRFTEKIVIK